MFGGFWDLIPCKTTKSRWTTRLVNGSSWCGSPVTPVTGCCIDPSVAPRRPFVRRRVGEAGEPSLRGLGSFWVREKHRLFVLVWRSLVWRSHLLRARWFCVCFVARFSVSVRGPLDLHSAYAGGGCDVLFRCFPRAPGPSPQEVVRPPWHPPQPPNLRRWLEP